MRRRHPELPQCPDPGAPGHASDPLPPCGSAPRFLLGPGPYQASIWPPSATPRVPLQKLDLQGAQQGRNRPVGPENPLPVCEESDTKVRGAVGVKPRVWFSVHFWIFLLPFGFPSKPPPDGSLRIRAASTPPWSGLIFACHLKSKFFFFHPEGPLTASFSLLDPLSSKRASPRDTSLSLLQTHPAGSDLQVERVECEERVGLGAVGFLDLFCVLVVRQ